MPHSPDGHNFVVYADCCSGVPDALHEANFAAINRVVAQLEPPPDFICFPGDEIIGLAANRETLQQQWAHWLNIEMAWNNRRECPIYHTTGNHTAYDQQSCDAFREALPHLPRNGPPGLEGLAYFVRKDDLLMLFVDTMGNGIGGEGRVETAWLAETLASHADATRKLVFGHHPVFAINGFAGAHSRQLAPENGAAFWKILVENGVTAYFCSHILAFDVQVHSGVLQILTAGAGTQYRMPPEIEYLHAVQVALDSAEIRYQVLDTEGRVREWLRWPFQSDDLMWQLLPGGVQSVPAISAEPATPDQTEVLIFEFSGIAANSAEATRQTLLSQWHNHEHLADFTIALHGSEQQLNIEMSQAPGRSPHLWRGPQLAPDQPFSIQVAIHPAMGPGGFLWRWSESTPWHSFKGTSAWGADRFKPRKFWGIGRSQLDIDTTPFRGQNLKIKLAVSMEQL